MLTRGKSGYDVVLHWLPNKEAGRLQRPYPCNHLAGLGARRLGRERERLHDARRFDR